MPAARQVLQHLLPSAFGSNAEKPIYREGYVRQTGSDKVPAIQTRLSRIVKTMEVDISHVREGDDEIELMDRR